MSTDQWEDEMLDFGNAESDIDTFDDPWLIDDQDVMEADDDLVAPSEAEVQSLIQQLTGSTANESSLNNLVDVVPEHAEQTPNNDRQSVSPSGTACNHTEVSIADLDDELREAFMDDASGCISSMESALLLLESDPTEPNALNQICRELHTLKGASASVGLDSLAKQLHHLEDTLTDDHQARRAPNINSLLASVDSIRNQIAVPVTIITGESDSAAVEDVPVGPQQTFFDDVDTDESVRVKASQLNRLMDMLAQLVMLRNRRGNELAELQEIYHELIGSVAKMRLISSDTDSSASAESSQQLTEVANDVMEVAQQVRACAQPISQGNTAVSQFIREFKEQLVELRRTPVAGLFQRLQRVVRDAAKAEGKEIDFKLNGADTGIERSFQQRLYEPLLHIVRNSVCHGIEDPTERQKSGKSASGQISLTATSGPDLLVIEIQDDGRGLDYDAIRNRGIKSGLLSRDQTASEQELAQLIFAPGFSTRDSTDQLAGRGVGMDVVASTLRKMRGWLEVDSRAGRGTYIRLCFPLPSVIQHAMVFRAGNQLFALPMQSIQSTGAPSKAANTIVLADLLFDGVAPATAAQQRITLAGEGSRNSKAGDTDEVDGQRITLLVDEIVGPEELVVRPLPSLLKLHPFCSGATLSGMGTTVLILDSRRLMERCQHKSPAPTCSKHCDSAEHTSPTKVPRVLVVDDSISARKRVVRSLSRYPVEIVEANDGKSALDLLKIDRFDAVFSDMEMPRVSGMELLAEVNADPDSNRPPVVIVSSRSESEFTDRASELGANNYLIKPLSDQALDDALIGIPSLQHFGNPIELASTNLENNDER